MSTIINYITNYFTELFEGEGIEGMIGLGCMLVAFMVEFIFPQVYSWGYAHEKHLLPWKVRIPAVVLMAGGLALALDGYGRTTYGADDPDGQFYTQLAMAMLIGIVAAIIILLLVLPLVKKLAKHDEETWAKNEKSYWEQHEGEEIHVAQTSREKDLTALRAVEFGLTDDKEKK